MKRLLIAHISQSFIDALTQHLMGSFDIACCSDGEEALQVLARFQPDVLILHTALPRKDGIALLQQSAHCPEFLLVTTDFLDPFAAYRLYNLGVMEVLVMPTVNTVLTTLWDMLGRDRCLLPEKPVTGVLHSLCFRPSLAGWKQVLLALEVLSKAPDQPLCKAVYPAVGSMLGTDSRAVEKAIRKAIGDAWKRGDRLIWKKYFPAGVCPGNREFLLGILQYDRDWIAQNHSGGRDMTVKG